MRASLIKEIEMHRKQNAHIVILSAALQYTCDAIASDIGIDDVICSQMETKQDVFTGNAKGNICIGEEKARQIKKYCSNKSFELTDAYYYGDSCSDRFAFETVGKAVCVAPERKLIKLAHKKHWVILE